MSRFLFIILGAIVLIQCGPSEPASKKVTVPFLGRWDVTASQGDEGYPLWFELEQVKTVSKAAFSLVAGIYGYVTPSRNTARPAGEWQELDVNLVGRWVTVVLNGETVIDHQEIPGITGGALDSNESEPGPIYLQGDHGAVSYRNIVLTPAVE